MNEFSIAVNADVSIVAYAAIDLESDKGLATSIMFTLWRLTNHSKIEIGYFYFSPMPGNCGMVVCHNMSLTEMSRHTGLSQTVRDLKEKIARQLGYSVMIATTDTGNVPAAGNMLKSKYKVVHTFTNKRTNNHIWVGVKNV